MSDTGPDKSEEKITDSESSMRKLWGYFGLALGLSFEVAVCVGIGAGIGYYLDLKFDTEPWLLLVFTMFGIAAAFNALIRTTRRMSKTEDKNESGSSE